MCPTEWCRSSFLDTAQIAESMGAYVHHAPEKPKGWAGKNCACWQGAQVARGHYLLFTDADTIHLDFSLGHALQFMNGEKAGCISAPPFHIAKHWWEKGLVFFHLLPLIATAYHQAPSQKRLFAIGQYLLFNRETYELIGGYRAIASSLVDDIDLARLCIKYEKEYCVYPDARLFKVQMYDSFQEFLRGWKRLLRLGMGRGLVGVFFEFILVFKIFFADLSEMISVGLLISAMLIVAQAQRSHGNFRFWGVLIIPVNIFVFTLLSLFAFAEKIFRRNVTWRDRTYGMK